MTQASDPARVPVIAIDGPSGSGKGTISRAVADTLQWHLLDSGALYRLVAHAARRAGVALDAAPALADLAARADIRFGSGPAGEERVWLDGIEVTRDIRTEAAGGDASRVAAIPAVRAALLARQRAFAVPPGLVADGRDMGTVIFPDAPFKVFLTASAAERAKRRYKQLKEKGLGVTLSSLQREIEARDHRDASRSVAPLKPAAEAVLVDTTGMGIDEVVARVLAVVQP